MQPLFAVHNNVSLLSVNIAPSTFLASLTLALVFLSLYLPRLPSLPLPRFLSFGRRRPDNDTDIVLRKKKQRIVRGSDVFALAEEEEDDDDDDEDGHYLTTRQRRHRDLFLTDLRHRQLPPLPALPPPPDLPLLREHGEVNSNRERTSKKRSTRNDGERLRRDKEKEREKEKEKEKAKLREKQQRSSSSAAPRPGQPPPTWSSADVGTIQETSILILSKPAAGAAATVTGTKTELITKRPGSATSLTAMAPTPAEMTEDGYYLAQLDVTPLASGPSSRLPRRPDSLHGVQQPQPQLPLQLGTGPHHQHHHHQQFLPQASENYSPNQSGFLETDTDNESMLDSVSVGGYSPPAWRRLGNGDRSSGFWRKGDNILGSSTVTQVAQQPALPESSTSTAPLSSPFLAPSPLQGRHQQPRKDTHRHPYSRESSPGFDSDDEDAVNEIIGYDDEVDRQLSQDHWRVGGNDVDAVLERAIRTRLPGSESPFKERSPEPEPVFHDVASRMTCIPDAVEDEIQKVVKEETPQLTFHESSENYIRFAVRAEVQHRTDLIELVIGFIGTKVRFVTRSWTHMVGSLLLGLLSFAVMRFLFQPAGLRPVPDLVKVAGIARSFEPLIYYSENGVVQVGDLQATGVAVWDLSESVRHSNLTSAPIIVTELDELSETLKTLAMELTRFFSNVDGDIDAILIVMDWARRELSQLNQQPSSSLSSLLPLMTSAYDNIHDLLSSTGVLENATTGTPTLAGSVVTALFGMSGHQRTRSTLRRTFHEFLGVLEEAVNSELQHSLALFALFEAVDRQFHNLGRSVGRETSVQAERHADLLSGLWVRILGPNAAEVKKYEQNRELLHSVHQKTVRNKGLLVEHNHRLLALKASLENLRRMLVSPLVRSVNSSTLTLGEQIRGLEDVGVYLERVRTRQKGKLMEMLYGAGTLRNNWVGSGDAVRPATAVGAVSYEASRMLDDSQP
ncbi:hypothetical protein SPI_00245 [Niveomyces insectorum RCEF 264]|uniref:Uncharacterized protein n=1 Tax=Niveomyces insectorum RCEF 264 TaxID=1081102 RepID=A0A167ZYX6_9HYPO|nr:hypothetical protein SPI_00245 [Niveomyces insectorum RCEF 264]